jgi:lipoyl(octanoyl) transferase
LNSVKLIGETCGGYIECELHEPGRLPYADALELQLSLAARCRRGEIKAALILLEHDPVITMGAAAKRENLLLSDAALNKLGISVVHTDRGGDVTYHGPGQVVAYPILNLRELRLDAHGYLRRLEQVVIGVLEEYGLEGSRCGPAGVWVGDRKVCSIGIAVRRTVTYHGLAFNVVPNMAHFSYINPCGLDAAQVTCLAELLDSPPDMAEVTSRLKQRFAEVFNIRFIGFGFKEQAEA